MSAKAVALAGLQIIADSLGETRPDPVVSTVKNAFSPIYSAMSTILVIFTIYAIIMDLKNIFIR
ncbi:hypothetical protein DRO19_01335 [Candidatus Bathyarchaeota archaeon]|nr:MAG: hypothetical protein DRO19_01335 [Candidatus Bathyarchaeota archaeon]